MSTLHRCTVPGISIQFAEGGKNFAVDEIVDLDATAPNGETWRDVLGSLVEKFEPVEPSEE